jgi:hypothetical protein
MTSRADYERQISWRMKQVMIGKELDPYKRFNAEYPTGTRRRDHPRTPDAHDARMSKRQFEGRVRAWKRAIFDMYPELGGSRQGSSPKCNFFVYESEVNKLDTLVKEARWINLIGPDSVAHASRRSDGEWG